MKTINIYINITIRRVCRLIIDNKRLSITMNSGGQLPYFHEYFMYIINCDVNKY